MYTKTYRNQVNLKDHERGKRKCDKIYGVGVKGLYEVKRIILQRHPCISVKALSTLTLPLSLAINLNLKIHQMDVNTAFPNAFQNNVVFVKLPLRFEYLIPNRKFFKLLKSRFGLKKSPRIWNKLLGGFLMEKNV